MPINSVQFAQSVCDEFQRYIFSEFPLSDPQKASHATEFFQQLSSERTWENARKPYYNVWPTIVPPC